MQYILKVGGLLLERKYAGFYSWGKTPLTTSVKTRHLTKVFLKDCPTVASQWEYCHDLKKKYIVPFRRHDINRVCHLQKPVQRTQNIIVFTHILCKVSGKPHPTLSGCRTNLLVLPRVHSRHSICTGIYPFYVSRDPCAVTGSVTPKVPRLCFLSSLCFGRGLLAHSNVNRR